MSDFKHIIAKRKRQDFIFNIVGILCTLVGILTLGALLADLLIDGLVRINWTFLTSFPSRFAERAGILSSWVGTLLIMIVTASAAVPLGVAAGIYLEEYARRNWLTNLIEINIANLAGVPSIIYGLMALSLLVYGRLNSRIPDSANCNCRNSRSVADHSAGDSRSRVCAWLDQVASGPISPAALFIGRNDDRNHHCSLASDW